MNERVRWTGLIFFLLASLGAGGLGSLATAPEIDGWYRGITKPEWNPPDWVFAPVWTTLYLMMGIAAWLVWKPAGCRRVFVPLMWFVIQLALNVAWSWVFFGNHQIGWAAVEIVFLWMAILMTTVQFYRCSKPAGLLMAPYLGWVTFAAILNVAIWQLNAS